MWPKNLKNVFLVTTQTHRSPQRPDTGCVAESDVPICDRTRKNPAKGGFGEALQGREFLGEDKHSVTDA